MCPEDQHFRFNIMAKPVSGLCNLDCRYCYYSSKPRELYPDVPRPMMDDATLESYVAQYLAAMPQQCDFGWQGGEPLLAGIEFYRKAIELQRRCAMPGQVVGNAIQTNGTLLDDAWCELLAANKFLVGLSLDGPPQWHDAFRRDHAGQGSFARAWAGLELLRKHKVDFNVLVTINSANAPHAGDIYRYFVNRGVHYIQFIPILERDEAGAPTPFSCTPQQYGRLLLDVFELWAARDVGRVSERFIDNVLHMLIYGSAASCTASRACANSFVLEFNGDLYACDHFVFDRWRLGNIMQTPLEQLVRCELRERFAALKTDLPAACRDCQYLGLCWGGCPKHHQPMGMNSTRVNYFCESYKMFFSQALGELNRMAEHFKRNQMPPPKATAGAGPASSATPGRNDPCPCGSGRKFKNCCGR